MSSAGLADTVQRRASRAAASLSRLKGLTKRGGASASGVRVASAYPLIRITGSSRRKRRMKRTRAWPSRLPGMTTSEITRAMAGTFSTMSAASWPLSASSTTQPRAPSCLRTTLRTSGSSSTSRTSLPAKRASRSWPSAAGPAASDAHAAARLLDEAIHHGQAQAAAHAELLGGEEGLENVGQNAPVHAGAIVADGDLHVVAGT